MKKILNILLLVMTLSAMIALGVYFAYDYYHDNLKGLNLTITRATDKGFIDYEETHNMVMEICDTANNMQVGMIPLDSVVATLNAIPWVVDVDANINLKTYLDVEIVECEPVMRIYNKNGKSVYLDKEGNIFPTRQNHVPHLLVGSGNVDFSVNDLGNVNDSVYINTELPDLFNVMSGILTDDYARNCVKQVFVDKKKNYIFSLNNTDIIVIFGDVNNIEEKLSKMRHFFNKMQGNPELDNYKEINLNYFNQVVCTKKNKRI